MGDLYKKKYLSIPEILAYSFGMFGFQIILFYLNSYQAEFYASTMQANLAIIGILLLVSRIVSAIADPIFGKLIDKKKVTKNGKFKPFILGSVIPLMVMTIIIFIKVPFRGVGLYAYIFITYTIWGIFLAMGDVPSQGISAVLTPNPKERSKIIAVSNTLKSIGQAMPMVIVPVVCILMPGGAGVSGVISSKEYLVCAIIAALLGGGLFSLIGFNKERVPYSTQKLKLTEIFTVLKDNKPLLLVTLSFFLGFARLLAMGIQIQASVAIMGGANLMYLFAAPIGSGAVVSMLITPFLVKKFNEKRVYIAMSLYGFCMSLVTYFVGYGNIQIFETLLFFVGLQYGAMNIIPSIMVADSIDYYEVKTGKRTEGIAFAVLSFSFKVTLAMAVALGLILMQYYNYVPDATKISQASRDGIWFTFTIVPGITSLACTIPLFFYKLVGKEKEKVTQTLKERRETLNKNATENDVIAK